MGKSLMRGFGQRINESRNTDFIHYVTAMDIPMVGTTKSRVLCEIFEGNLDSFEKALQETLIFQR